VPVNAGDRRGPYIPPPPPAGSVVLLMGHHEQSARPSPLVVCSQSRESGTGTSWAPGSDLGDQATGRGHTCVRGALAAEGRLSDMPGPSSSLQNKGAKSGQKERSRSVPRACEVPRPIFD
jgi:hypothetical protein